MTRPMPKPVTNMKPAASQGGRLGDRPDSKKSPRVMIAVPTMGNTRYLPVRETIWPPTMDVMQQPAMSGSRSSPEPVGEAPLTTWK